MANNGEAPLSVVDGVTPEYVRLRDGPLNIPAMAGLETPSRNGRDKRGRSADRSQSPGGRRRRGESHAQRTNSRTKMAAEMELLKRQIKGKGVTGEGNLSERTPSPRYSSRRQERTHSLSITRNYGVGDSNQGEGRSLSRDNTYRPSRPTPTSGSSFSIRSRDLRDVLEERERCREARRVPALQRLSAAVRYSEEVAVITRPSYVISVIFSVLKWYF